jgi:2-hydroxy-3-oxopropionate reductase
VHGERILTGNYKPGFRAKLYSKDYRIAAETLAANGSPSPVSSAVRPLVDTLAANRGDADYSAMATVIFKMAGLGEQ